MDRMKRLTEAIRVLMEEEFSGYIKINFSQGSLGRIEKSEELEDAAHILMEEKKAGKKSTGADICSAKKMATMALANLLTVATLTGTGLAAEMERNICRTSLQYQFSAMAAFGIPDTRICVAAYQPGKDDHDNF